MREVGVDSPFAAREREYSFGLLNIQSDCEKWLLDIEQNLGSSLRTFDAVQWALCELERMERNSNLVEVVVIEDEADRTSSSREQREGESGELLEKLPSRLEPAVIDLGNKDAASTVTGSMSERESLDEKLIKRTNQDASLSGPKIRVEQVGTVNVTNWRQIFTAGPGGKRKIDGETSPNDGGKRAKVSDVLYWKRPEEVLREADRGEAGKRMAERINCRLAIPECNFLTNLVSHCLLVSMDQVPTEHIQDAVPGVSVTGVADFNDENEGNVSNTLSGVGFACDSSDSDESMWLHDWIVRTVLSEARFASLDWLIAFMSSTRQTFMKPILIDRASDLVKRETEGFLLWHLTCDELAFLEYAAVRRWD